jgi:serine/threonine-protein kinase RsbW
VSGQPVRLALELAPDLGEISRLIQAFENLGERLQLAPDTLYQMTLVLDELVTNVISYGGIGPSDGPIHVEFKAADGVLETIISDPGKPFDPRNAPEPDTGQALEERKIGGLGVHLVRSIVDSFDYCYAAGRNRVTLRKRLALAAP